MINFQDKLENNSLKLKRTQLSKQDVAGLLVFLENNPQITELAFTEVKIRTEDLERIATSPAMRNVSKVRMEASGLSDKEAIVLSKSPYITEMNLDWNLVGLKGLEALVDSNLVALSLAGNDLGPEAAVLARSKTIANLNLERNNLGTGTVELAKMPNLRKLNLDGNKVGIKELEALADSQIISLSLKDNHLGPEAAVLAKSKTLADLNLANNKVGIGTVELAKMPNLKKLNLDWNKVGIKELEALADSQIISLSLKDNDLGPEAAVLAKSKNLVDLNLANNKIAERAIEFAKMPNLRELNLANNRLWNKHLVILARSKITKLNLDRNFIGTVTVEALARSNLVFLSLAGNDLEPEASIALAKRPDIKLKVDLSVSLIIEKLRTYYQVRQEIILRNPVFSSKFKIDHGISSITEKLRTHYQTKQENVLKELMFSLARYDTYGSKVRYFLESLELPFLINSVNEAGHNLASFYTHLPDIQQFLFRKGCISSLSKAKETNSAARTAELNADRQSTHAPEAVRRTRFFTDKLVTELNQTPEALLERAEAFKGEIGKLFNQNTDMAIKLLDLTEVDKKEVMEDVLDGRPVPSDEKFVREVIEKAQEMLERKYLNPKSEYYTDKLQYDWNPGSEKHITIPQSIGLIAYLADTMEPSEHQMKTLTANLYTKKTTKSRSKAFQELNSLTEEQIKARFKELSNGLDIEEVFGDQVKFMLLQQVYMAATTYAGDSGACVQGTWSQIIDTYQKVSQNANDEYAIHDQKRIAADFLLDDITEGNIRAFADELVNEELLKVDGVILSDKKLTDALDNLVRNEFRLKKPKTINLLEQSILAQINTAFCNKINEYLPNFTGREENNLVPTREQYQTLTEQIARSPRMEQFLGDPDAYLAAHQPAAELPVVEAATQAPSTSGSHVERLNRERDRSQSPDAGPSRR